MNNLLRNIDCLFLKISLISGSPEAALTYIRHHSQVAVRPELSQRRLSRHSHYRKFRT